MRKSRLGLAVGAALGASMLAPGTSFGWSVDTQNGNLTTSSGGDTLLFPIYTTAVGASTTFSVTNTSNTQTVAAKIRFREQTHSMDVLDFIVVLSPNDKFDFFVDQLSPATRPTMHWNDTSCIVGPAEGATSQEFQAPSQFVASEDLMSVGHLEVLGMADLTNACVSSAGQGVYCAGGNPAVGSGDVSLAHAADHDSDGNPYDCKTVVDALKSDDVITDFNTLSLPVGGVAPANPALTDVDNVLVGRFVIDNGMTGEDGVFHTGIEAGSDAIGIQDSDLGPPAMPFAAQWPTACTNASPFPRPAPSNPTANCTSYYAWDTLEFDHPHLAEIGSGAGTLNGFQLALQAFNVAGDWSNNPGNFVGVDWILSFPDKYAYLDYIGKDLCEGGSDTTKEWCLLNVTNTAFASASATNFGLLGAWTGVAAPGALGPPIVPFGRSDLCLTTSNPTAWDTEEQESSGSVSVSPGTLSQLEICNELNIFTLSGQGQTPRASVIQTADLRQVLTFDNLDALRGWALIDLPFPLYPPTNGAAYGDAVSGLIFTLRATTGAADENGSLTDLQKNVTH
jgi:hypothetical protein